jgi:ATP-binding cassette subfamily F protein 3
LNKYEGTFVLVSHDRYFVSKTANKIWEIVDHEIKEFKGGYEEYVQWKERMQSAARSQQSAVKSSESGVRSRESKKSNEPGNSNVKNEPKPQTSNNKPQTTAPINKEHKKELQKQQRIFQQLEEKGSLTNKTKK